MTYFFSPFSCLGIFGLSLLIDFTCSENYWVRWDLPAFYQVSFSFTTNHRPQCLHRVHQALPTLSSFSSSKATYWDCYLYSFYCRDVSTFAPISPFLSLASPIIIVKCVNSTFSPCPLHPDRRDLKSERDCHHVFSIYLPWLGLALKPLFWQMIIFDLGWLFVNF